MKPKNPDPNNFSYDEDESYSGPTWEKKTHHRNERRDVRRNLSTWKKGPIDKLFNDGDEFYEEENWEKFR